MIRLPICILTIFLSGIIALADPPKLEIEPVIEAKGDYVTFSPHTDASVVTYIGLSGLEPFPSEMLRDGKAFILPVRGLKEGNYSFVAIGIKQNEYTRKDFVIKIPKNDDVIDPIPIPKPKPKPDPKPPEPKPDPKLDDAPVQTTGLYVAFVFETGPAQRITSNQFNILYGATTRNYLNTICDRTNNQPNWRVIDKDAVALSDPWKDLLKRKRGNVPTVVVIANKKYMYEAEITPTMTPEEFIKILDKYKPAVRTDYCPNCPAPYTYQITPIDR